MTIQMLRPTLTLASLLLWLGACGAPVAPDVAPGASSPAAWTSVLSDHFDAAGPAWPTGDNIGTEVRVTKTIEGGKYRWWIDARLPTGLEQAPKVRAARQFRFAFQAQQVKGPNDARYGVLIRSARGDSTYCTISNAPDAECYAVRGGKLQYFLNRAQAPTVRPGEANTLSFELLDSRLTFSINGQVMAQATDMPGDQYSPGLFVGIPLPGVSIFEFDDTEMQAR